jgi:hypothetical protein
MDDILRDSHGRFAKGKKGGPGRPKLGLVLSDILREAVADPDPSNPEKTKFQHIVETLINNAMQGDIPSTQIILNRIYGKEIDLINISSGDELDLGKLSDEELVLYNDLLGKILDVKLD